MTEQESIARLLRQALPPTSPVDPARDLWPALLSRSRPRRDWLWFDITVAAAVVMTLWLSPDWLWLLLYHL